MADEEQDEKEPCTRCGKVHESDWALRVRRADLDKFMKECLEAVDRVVVPLKVPGMDKALEGLGGRLFDAASNAIGALISAPQGENDVRVGIDVSHDQKVLGVFGVRAMASIEANGADPEAKCATVRLAFDMALVVGDVYVETLKDPDKHAHQDTVGTA